MTVTRTTLTTTAAALLLALAPAAWALNASQALQVMQNNGYVAAHGLVLEHGHWTAQATSQAGQRAHLLVHDATSGFTAIQRADIGTKLPGAAQVTERLRSLGYAVIHDVAFDDGFWEAEVRQSRRGEKIELVLHPVSLAVLSQTSAAGNANANVLPAAQILQLLQQAGYTQVRDLEFDDGRWEAEAYNAAGQPVDLSINAATGAVEREKLDD
ncbi:hypothetical protein CCO03_05135 [Comamonas serinivorans]|uniref:PepSY domain-containing protein n=1 Tax=Comamonas serinivorans TaxID=1082851 RepID=A0A1Y0ELA1_9BURK|nr:PepSY domain-containing protein [Comamonas serinivorans]ARU04139.1 hypothetical protein CCO03_05135 [Comamonas serinivorans]